MRRILILLIFLQTSQAFFTEQTPYMLSSLASFAQRAKQTVSATSLRMASSTAISDTITTCSDTKSKLVVAQFQCLDDNYGYLIHDEATGETAAVDTPCASTYTKELEKRNWKLTHIFNTHHHWDHTGGNNELKSKYDATIMGPKVEEHKIPSINVPLSQGDAITLGGNPVQILDVGGHTTGHIAYYFPHQNKVFCGDALFALGCGKMFEGTPEQFWSSLVRLRELPDETTVYCAHEYTMGNAKFAKSVEPNNQELMDRVKEIERLRKENLPTVPSNLGLEKRTNPFLRVDVSAEIRANVHVKDGDDDATAFKKVRSAKDNFRG